MRLWLVWALAGTVGVAGACTQPLVTWVPIVGAAGLVLRAAQSPKRAVPTAATGAERMSLAKFESLYAKGTVLVVDVRSAETFRAGHIPTALSVPIDEVERRAPDVMQRAGSLAIVTYCSCANEHTSAIAAEILTRAGACRVSALAGGYPAWVAGGRAVERGEGTQSAPRAGR